MRPVAAQSWNMKLRWILATAMLVPAGCQYNPHRPKDPTETSSTTTQVEPTPPAAADEINPLAGPTLMRKVPGGYELKNRHVRAIIDDQTGNLIYWGRSTTDRNLVLQPGIVASLAGLPDATMQGYIEKRDDQTWQFIGEDSNRTGWRKIYCLEGDSLLISILVQNQRAEPLDVTIQFQAPFAGVRILRHDRDQFEALTGFGTIHLQAYNEFPATSPAPPLPVVLVSDPHTLQAQERISFTTEWKLGE